MIESKKINVVLFFNNQRGLKTFLYLKKQKDINILKIFLSKKFLDKKVYSKVRKYNPTVITNPNTKRVTYFIKKNKIDFNLVCGFPYIFNSETLSIPRYCSLNLHGGKLPNYRGGSPLNWQIINNEKVIGISVIKMEKKIDKGPVIKEKNFFLKKKYDIRDVHRIANSFFPSLLMDSIKLIYRNPNKVFKKNCRQNDKYYKQRQDKDGKIDWTKKKLDNYNLIRAITKPYPCAYSFDPNRKKIRIIKCKIIDSKKNKKYFPGKVTIINKKLFVDCIDGRLQILKSSRKLNKVKLLN